MTSNIKFERITKEVEGFKNVIFYLSTDQQISGISLNGLSNLTNVPSSTLRTQLGIVVKEALNTVESNNDDNLSIVVKEDIYIKGIFENKNINIIPSTIASDIILYYAYESDKASTEVKEHCKKVFKTFAQKGLHQWIKESQDDEVDTDNPLLQPTEDRLISLGRWTYP